MFLKKLTLLLSVIVLSGTLLAVPVANAQTEAESNLFDGMTSFLAAKLVEIGGVAAWAGGTLLDESVRIFVIQMGEFGKNPAVEEGWGIVRDLVNLTFVFGLLYVGIMTIIKGESGQTREWLVRIIIGALLVNFSLFIARVVIDLSNVAAIELHGKLGGMSISQTFMDQVGLQRSLANDKPDLISALVFMFMAFIAGFVFAAGAIMLMIRAAVLVLLMVLSPVMFVATFLPFAGSWANRWWQAMIGQSLFAPAFMFTVFVAINVIRQSGMPRGNAGTLAGSGIGGEEIAGGTTLFYFAISMVMLVAGLIIAKQMGMYGANSAISIGRGALRKTGRWAMAPVQAGGRWTLGRGAQGVRKWSESAGAALRDSQPSRGRFGKLASVGARGVVRAGGAAAGKVEKTKFGGRSIVDAQKASEERGRTLDRASRANNLKTAIAGGIQPGSTLTQPQKDAIGSMSFNELKDLGAEKVGKLAAQGYLTDDQAKKIKDSKDEDFSPADRTSIETARLGYFENQVKTGTAIDDGKVRGLSPDAITKLPKPVLEAVISDAAGLSALVDRINVGNLKQMVKDKVKPALRDDVSSEIQSRTGGTAWTRPAGPRSSWASNDHKLRDWLESPDGSDF